MSPQFNVNADIYPPRPKLEFTVDVHVAKLQQVKQPLDLDSYRPVSRPPPGPVTGPGDTH